MINKNSFKYKIANNRKVFNFIRVVYTSIVHRERLMRRKCLGPENKDKTVLIIRPNSEDGIQGLMSLFIQISRWIQYADEHKYLAFIDLKNYKTQYFDGVHNAWDFYFQQPDGLTYDEAYKSNDVLFSGVSLKKTTDETIFIAGVFRNAESLEKSHSIIEKKIKISDEATELIESENSILHVEESIGVYLRGTDYVKLKPPGEFRQPEISDVVKKIREFTTTYRGRKVFLVTEDAGYYKILKKEFPELLCTVSFDSFISGYDGKNYLSKTGLLENDKKKRGMDYLIKIILLSKCRYLISSITMGSIAAYCFNGGKYEDEYIFDLGYYE